MTGMDIKKIILTAVHTFLFLGITEGGVNLGFNVCNNRWNNHWLFTPAPEVSCSGRWFWIGVDGTLGSYTPSNDGYIFQTRFSLMPMVRVPLVGPFFTAAGYGFSYVFCREEFKDANGDYQFTSHTDVGGEIRSFFGMEIPLFARMKIYTKGGYAFINKNHQYYFVSIGTSLVWPKASVQKQKKINSILTEKNMQRSAVEEEIENLAFQNIREQTPIKTERTDTKHLTKVAIIGTNDPIINELNTAIEAALIKSEIPVYSWHKIKDMVEKRHQRISVETTQTTESLPSLEFMSPMDIALEGSQLMDLSVIIETQMRYSYKTYGGEILVNSAYARIIQPASGQVLWTTEYTNIHSKFVDVKKTLTTETTKALTSLLH